jgi:hypothetical protein
VTSFDDIASKFDALLGPGRPELTCEQCFEDLDRYTEHEIALAAAPPGATVAFETCAWCEQEGDCRRERRCLGMRAHLEGCPACAEEHESLLALVALDAEAADGG